jgi:hypothetical protein
VEAREVAADECRDDKEQRLLRQVAALECEVARYEVHFETLKAQLNDYKRKNRELQDIVCMLKRAMKDPDPYIEFGEKREEYNFHAYRFAAKILNTKLTCATAKRVTEVFMEEFFPKRSVRIPSVSQWERWRQDMLLTGRYKALKLMQLCDVYHILGDATTAGKSLKSRKTSVYQTAAIGSKGDKTYRVSLDFAVIEDSTAETECNAMLKALELELGTELTAKLSILNCYSGHTDHANGAMAASELFGEKKKEMWEAVTVDEKAMMSKDQIAIASTYKKRGCAQHAVNVAASHYIGTRFTPENANSHPDKHQITHGKVEFAVLARFCGADVLLRHMDVARGRAVVCGNVVIHRIALTAWGFQKLQAH